MIDTTFGVAGKVSTDFGARGFDRAHSAALQADGSIVAAGFAISANGISQNFAVARYTSSGVLDFLLARLSSRGSLDATFGVGGKVRTSFGDLNGGANGAALQSDGKIVAVGFQATFSNRWTNFALARYLGQ